MSDTLFSPIFIKLPTAQIVFLKFLLESYEGIAELRTLNKEEAVVVILALKDTREAVEKMLEHEKAKIQWEYLKEPPELDGDWLLHNYDLE